MELQAGIKWNRLMVSVFMMVVLVAVFSVSDNARLLAASRADESGAGENVVVFRGGSAWLGVRLADVTAEKMAQLKLREEAGAIVAQVEEGSPAAKAGLQTNDVIIEYQGQRVESAAQLQRMVHETPAGRTVRLEVIRNGQRQALTAKLEERQWPHGEMRMPEIHIPQMRVPDFNIEIFGPQPQLGISGDALTPQLAEFFGVKQGKGVLVREVREGSAAAKAGLKAGDVIVQVDNAPIEDIGDLRHALHKKKGGETVMLTIVRQKAEQTLKVQLDAGQPSPRQSAYGWDSSQFLQDFRESMEHWRPELQQLTEQLRRELGEKARTLQEDLNRLQQELQKSSVM